MTFDRDYSLEPDGSLWDKDVPVPGGLDIQWFVTGEQSKGRYCLAKYTMRDQVLPHVHNNDDEALFILSGEPTLTISGKEYPMTPGGFVFMPQGQPHSIASDAEWSCLGISAPSGFDELIRDLGELTASGNLTPERVVKVQAKYGVQNVDVTGSWWGKAEDWTSGSS